MIPIRYPGVISSILAKSTSLIQTTAVDAKMIKIVMTQIIPRLTPSETDALITKKSMARNLLIVTSTMSVKTSFSMQVKCAAFVMAAKKPKNGQKMKTAT